MAPTQLLDLPNELLTRIVSMVRENGEDITGSWLADSEHFWTASSAHVAAVAATCKTLNAVAIPILYYAPSATSHMRLLRTLVNRPDLAARVRALDCKNRHDYDEDVIDDESGDRLSTEDLEPIVAAAKRLKLVLTKFWYLRLTEDMDHDWHDGVDMHMFHFLIALVADNLEALRITTFRDSDRPSPLIGSEIKLPRLRFMAISHWGTEGSFDLDEHIHVLNICPNLEHLWLTRCGAVSPGLYEPHPYLKSLRMSECPLEQPCLERLLAFCPCLEEFCCVDRFWWQFREDEFTFEDAVRLLKPMAGTLRHLILGPELENPEATRPLRRMDSLAEFTNLETLLVYPSTFSEAVKEDRHTFFHSRKLLDLLPKGVRYLALLDFEHKYEPQIALVEAIKEGVFPNLQKVVLNFDTYEEEEKEATIAAFADVDVLCIQHDQKLPVEWAQGLPTMDFVPGKDFLRPNPNHWEVVKRLEVTEGSDGEDGDEEGSDDEDFDGED